MAAVTRDGQKLALISNADPGNPEPQIEIWDLPREQLLGRLPPGFHTDASFDFTADGRYLLSQAMQGTRIYDTTTFSVVDEFSGLGNSASSSSFLPGTKLVAVARPQQRPLSATARQRAKILKAETDEAARIQRIWEDLGTYVGKG